MRGASPSRRCHGVWSSLQHTPPHSTRASSQHLATALCELSQSAVTRPARSDGPNAAAAAVRPLSRPSRPRSRPPGAALPEPGPDTSARPRGRGRRRRWCPPAGTRLPVAVLPALRARRTAPARPLRRRVTRRARPEPAARARHVAEGDRGRVRRAPGPPPADCQHGHCHAWPGSHNKIQTTIFVMASQRNSAEHGREGRTTGAPHAREPGRSRRRPGDCGAGRGPRRPAGAHAAGRGRTPMAANGAAAPWPALLPRIGPVYSGRYSSRNDGLWA